MIEVETYKTLGDFSLGKGSIGPKGRQDIDAEILKDMFERVASGEFHESVEDSVPVICVDGRLDGNGQRMQAPSSAGGTAGLAYACLLALVPYTTLSEEALVDGTVSTIKTKGHRISVHNASPCKCGACEHCPAIFEHIVQNSGQLNDAATALGVPITDDVVFIENAQSALGTAFFKADRSKPLIAGKDQGANEEILVGGHQELAIFMNMIPGTTISRQKIRQVFGPTYDCFVVDAWSFGEAAKVFATDEKEAERLHQALVLYNLATASVLSHESMPVITTTAIAT